MPCELRGVLRTKTFYQKSFGSGRGAVGLAHLNGVQGVAGSNPAVPTRLARTIKRGL